MQKVIIDTLSSFNYDSEMYDNISTFILSLVQYESSLSKFGVEKYVIVCHEFNERTVWLN